MKRYNETSIFKVKVLNIRSDEWGDFSEETCAWFHTYNRALKCVRSNYCDIQDCVFNYAVILESYEGCYGLADEEMAWFKWNKQNRKWEQVSDRPKALDNIHLGV